MGSSVTAFKPGDRVVAHLSPRVAEKAGDDAPSGFADISEGLGQAVDGTLRSAGVFPETALVHAPASLDWAEAATLTCSGLTAWNALFGIRGRELRAGDWVLVQGTGGVSVAALQFAAAAGATVVATTSTEEKAARLRGLGAKHTINYRTNPDGWGVEARNLTPEGRGFDFVVDIAGNATLAQSLAAIRTDGIIAVVGMAGGDATPVPMMGALAHACTVRGLLLGSRRQFQDMVRFVDEKRVVPALDDVVFGLHEVKEAYKRLQEQKHFSKVVIKINH